MSRIVGKRCDLVVFGPGWSKKDAPLEAADAKRLSALVAKAHEHGMRVVLAVPYSSAAGAGRLFKGLLVANRDGLMIYGLGPRGMKPAEDLAARVETLARLRRTVGNAGVLIGRADKGFPTQVEMSFMDTVIPGDDVAAGMVASPTRLLASAAAVGCSVSPIVKGDDRRAWTALAGVPASPQLLITPDVTGDEPPRLWKLLARLDGPVVHALSPRLENNPKLQVEPKTAPVVAYMTKSRMLLVVASPSRTKSCKITIARKLGVKPDAAGTLLTFDGAELKEKPFKLTGGVIDLGELTSGDIRAYEFTRTSGAP